MEDEAAHHPQRALSLRRQILMIRESGSKTVFVAAVGVLAGVLSVACGQGPDAGEGTAAVGQDLTLPGLPPLPDAGFFLPPLPPLPTGLPSGLPTPPPFPSGLPTLPPLPSAFPLPPLPTGLPLPALPDAGFLLPLPLPLPTIPSAFPLPPLPTGLPTPPPLPTGLPSGLPTPPPFPTTLPLPPLPPLPSLPDAGFPHI
jgi:hypothetical protein